MFLIIRSFLREIVELVLSYLLALLAVLERYVLYLSFCIAFSLLLHRSIGNYD